MTKILMMVAQRLALGLLTLFVVSLIIFLGVELLPGDLAQAILGQAATPETVAAFRKELKLDLPAHERYIEWLVGILQGDMGKSLANQREISELIGTRLGNTLFLAAFAAVVDEIDWVRQRAMRLIEREFTPVTWRVFQRVVLDNEPPAKVAQDEGMTVWAVYKVKARVLQRLRAELGEWTDRHNDD